jgi:ATP-dependent helicase/nuclease subunit A
MNSIFSSTWVNASAGSGKTHALTQRYLNLIKQNVKPEEILCITFTNNAASEMKERISKHLLQLVHAQMTKIETSNNTSENNQNTNIYEEIFIENFEESNKIQTLHSFCQEIIQKKHTALGITVEPVLMEYEKKIMLEIAFSKTIEDRSYRELLELVLEKISLSQLEQIIFSNNTTEEYENNLSDNKTLQTAIRTLSIAVENKYRILKQNRLNYDEIITTALDFLENSSSEHFIRHILVDEAQDINEPQWKVISRLYEDITCSVPNCSIFVVGDAKQAIYSFHGAHAGLLQKYHDHIKNITVNTGGTWDNQRLHVSYRSSPIILNAINNVFGRNSKNRILIDKHYVDHEACAENIQKKGLFEIYSPATSFINEKNIKISASQKLAEEVSTKIYSLLNEPNADHNKLMPGDIMILLRNRSKFMEHLEKALNSNNLSYETAAKTSFTTVVMPFTRLLSFALAPHSDFNSAFVLSNLLNIRYETIGDIIAKSRNANTSLFDFLTNTNYSKSIETYISMIEHDRIKKTLLKIANIVTCRPYSANSFILLKLSNIMRLKSQHISALMVVYDNYKSTSCGDLYGFLEFLQAYSEDVELISPQGKEKDMSKIKILTIHGAKGLQSRVVFLPDTTVMPTHMNGMEYYRLMYVAMTRAEECLYIYGWQNGKKIPPECFYDVLSKNFLLS